MSTTVVAMYDRKDQAEAAMHDLTDAGFERSSMEVVAHDKKSQDRPESFWQNLFGSGDDSEDVNHLAEGVRRGGAVLTITVDEAKVADAERVLNLHDPVDIDERVEKWRGEGYTSHDPKASAYDAQQVEAERERYSIPIVEENIEIGKREVQGGGKRIRTFVRETPVEESVTLRDETVTVERRPVDRVATEADFEEQNFEMLGSREEAVVSKEARVVEEVMIDKETVERTETVRGTERKTEVEVDELDSKDLGKKA